GGSAMKILVAVDGSRRALAAVRCVVDHADWYREKPSVELLTVHLPVPTFHGMSAVIGRQHFERYYRQEGEERLAAARKMLDAAAIPYHTHILVGQIAESIVEKALATGCGLICIGSRGMGDLAKALLGSTATKVLHLSKLPVLLVRG
ncbi:MAG: universal stress protein, partial [Burkholderiales bacterium]